MKRKKSTLLIFSVFLCSCHESHTGANTASQNTQTDTANSYFYKRMEGTVAGKPVMMHLHKTNKYYEGIYYYQTSGQWLQLNTDSSTADSIFFSEYSPGDNASTGNAQLRLAWQEDQLAGMWISPDKQQTYPVLLKESYPDGSYRFRLLSFEDSLVAFPGKEDAPVARLDVSLVTAPANPWLNTAIKELVGQDTLQEFETGFRKLAKSYFDEYKINVSEADTSLPLHLFNYARSGNVFVRYNDNGLVVLEHAYYEYSGGAHGNYGSSFYCFDVLQNRRLALSNLIQSDSAALQRIVEQHFRTQYHLKNKPLKTILFDDRLSLSPNFYVTNKGIGFLYNPYEVAPYAQGQINVFVPFKSLDQYLTTFTKERLTR